MAFIPGMQTAAVQAASMVEESGKPTFAQKAELGAGIVGEVVGVMQAMRDKQHKDRMKNERKRREAMQIEGAGNNIDLFAANMPGHNPYAERPIS